MYLKNIKLSGFKSFVDATQIPIKSALTAIVGPNGCGKSNVVDAIRWVIGETSAKQLRGQLMADIIFNGTAARKQVGRASVELIFDNSEGRIVGEYAKFSEVSIRREVEREGQSTYFINNVPCRRRDIVDIFLGTGLGPRSYAVIEQGMISQLIEAKPEDLRIYLEEAAGISKYKERRRETENRMRRTQENLDRLNDLREELEKQLRHLKRQANAAERYKELKQEERLLHVQMKALQWNELQQQLQIQDECINQQVLSREEQQTQLRQVETRIEKSCVEQMELTEKQNEVQKRYYGLGAEIARVEQEIKHMQEQMQRWQSELNEADELWQEITDSTAEHQEQIVKLTTQLEELIPKSSAMKSMVQQSQQALLEAEARMNDWQLRWDTFQSESAQCLQQVEVAKTKIEHYQSQLIHLNQRIEQLQQRQSKEHVEYLTREIQPLAEQTQQTENELTSVRLKLQKNAEAIHVQRQANNELNQTLQNMHREMQTLEARHATADTLQQSVLGVNDEKTKDWLQQHHLQECSRLGKVICVNPGWELAVETVLSDYLDAVCVDDVSALIEQLGELEQGTLTLIENKNSTNANQTNQAETISTLASQVRSDWSLDNWLRQIFIAEDIHAAIDLRASLQPHESVITKTGIWLGPTWIRMVRPANNESGILLREQEIQKLKKEIDKLSVQVAEKENIFKTGETKVVKLEKEREEQHQIYQEFSTQLTNLQTQLSAKQSRLDELQQQYQRLEQELLDCQQQQKNMQQMLMQTEEDLQVLLQQQRSHEQNKQALITERENCRNELEKTRTRAEQDRQQSDEIEIRLTSNESQLALLKQTVSRFERQLQQLSERRKTLSVQLTESGGPLEKLSATLQELLSHRMTIEEELRSAENTLQVHKQQIKDLETQRHRVHQKLNEIQNQLQELKLQRQTHQVRQTTLEEQIVEMQFELSLLLNEMPSEANIETWEQRAEKVAQRITRLGPINLAAIDEYKTLNERKEYLDKQYEDLVEALTVLENAIRKIDKETRSKFRETYHRVNEQFQAIFPRIFGGGRAVLEMLDDNVLTTGIIVRAQPPGKRNVTIHMLSGGEKALTAIALVFALFQLNPAPFCILDEVDAPLDDANVGRFCQLVREMTINTQFIVISHNKVTIEMADHLMGVTMQEAGVSRIVSVDMAQAMEMVA